MRRFQLVSGHPSDETIIYSAVTNNIKNSPITRQDVQMTLDQINVSKFAIQGKTTKSQPPVADADKCVVDLPPEIMEYYKNVELSIDVLHVNSIPFLGSVSKNIHYIIVNPLVNIKIPTMEKMIMTIIHSYAIRVFYIAIIHVDIQFKAIKDRNLLKTKVNVVSKGEHVPEIKRVNRMLKERACCYYAMLVEAKIYILPKQMVMQLMNNVSFYVNAFVWRQGVSQVLSPLTIMEGTVLDFNKHFHVIFGEYVHTYEGTTNNMKLRTVGALTLGPSRNLQGGIRCFSLETGKIFHRFLNDVTILKMPDDVLRRLTYIVRKEKSVQGLVFGDRNDNNQERFEISTGVGDDAAVTIATDTNATENDNAAIDTHVNHPTELQLDNNTGVHEGDTGRDNHDDANATDDVDRTGVAETDVPNEPPEDPNDVDTADDVDRTEVAGTDDDPNEPSEDPIDDEIQPPEDPSESDSDEDSEEDDAVYTTCTGRASKPYNMEQGYPKLYGNNNYADSSDSFWMKPYYCDYYDEKFELKLGSGTEFKSSFFSDGVSITELDSPNYDKQIKSLELSEYHLYTEALQWLDLDRNDICSLVFKAKQMGIQQGIKQYGDDGKESVMKEIRNLTTNECFGEISFETLTQEMKDRALPILMFMIMKRNGNLKSRGVADVRVQRVYTNKDDCSSPTPDFYALKYMVAVIAKEARDCASIDLPAFFL